MSNILPFVYGFVAGGACVGGWWWWINNRAKARAELSAEEARIKASAQTVKNLADKI